MCIFKVSSRTGTTWEKITGEEKKKISENTLSWYAYHTGILILASAILSEMEIQAILWFIVTSPAVVPGEEVCVARTRSVVAVFVCGSRKK